MRYADIQAELTAKTRGHEEDDLQINLVKHVNWRLVPGVMFWHTPNGGKRSLAAGKRLKAMGVRRGVLDLTFLLPGPRMFMLELKWGDGRMSDDQEEFARELDALGIEWACAWTLDNALTILEAVGAIRPEGRLARNSK